MRRILFIFSAILCLGLVSCSKPNSHIPDTSIIDELSVDELSDILDYEKSHEINYEGFEEFYPQLRRSVSIMSQMEKAKFSKLTYRELLNGYIEYNDTTGTSELKDEWEELYNSYLPKAKLMAREMDRNITNEYRMEAFASGNYNDFDFLRRRGYAKYLRGNGALLPQYITEESWNYEAIIKDKIDSDFRSKESWVRRQKLEKIKDNYPMAYEVLSARQNALEQELDRIINRY